MIPKASFTNRLMILGVLLAFAACGGGPATEETPAPAAAESTAVEPAAPAHEGHDSSAAATTVEAEPTPEDVQSPE